MSGAYRARMAVTTRPATWPFAWVTADAQLIPAVIRHWEKGHPPAMYEWHARVVIAGANGPMEMLVPAVRVKAAR